MVWFHLDPECGIYQDTFGGTYKYENGRTLAEDYPEMYFQAPWYAALVFGAASFLKSKAAQFVCRWNPHG